MWGARGAVQPSSSEDREHVKVYLRVRPFTAAEAQNGESQVIAGVWLPKAVVADATCQRACLSAGLRVRGASGHGPAEASRRAADGSPQL